MISAVAAKYNIHPQTLRLYEREGLLKPSRTEGNTRLYSDEDLQELETILALTRDLGVNLAGVEIILNMRRKMERMQREVNEFMQYVKQRARARPRRLGAAAEHGARADHDSTSATRDAPERRRDAARRGAQTHVALGRTRQSLRARRLVTSFDCDSCSRCYSVADGLLSTATAPAGDRSSATACAVSNGARAGRTRAPVSSCATRACRRATRAASSTTSCSIRTRSS